MLPRAVLTHLNAGVRAEAGPEPVLITSCLHPASVTAPKHARPSLTTSQPGSRLRRAKPESAWVQKLLTRRSFSRTGLPSGVVSTAATNGVLPGAALATRALAADIGVVDLHPPGQAFVSVALHHHLLKLVPHLPGRGLPHPQAAAQLDTGDPLLALCQVIHGAEPQAQRHMRRGEDGARDQRGLATAGTALEQPTAPNLAMRLAAAHRTLKAL